MSPWLFDVYMDAVMKSLKMRIGRKRVRFLELVGEWRLPCILYTDDLVLRGESEEDLRALECKIHVDGICLEHISEFKYLACVLDESGTDGSEFGR